MAPIRVGTLSELAAGQFHCLDADGTKVILGQVGAACKHCPHLGFSLTTGSSGTRFSDGELQWPLRSCCG
ncbi:hypothetical protein [Ferrimicrobium acidiphilum]|uniref:hypothetical protein n=1 Tax=Ferrimicrobium acidiphilum TaxID=121039 RepID=UPI0023F117FA|nr:hypothetical protein [Ferrimicrobium acidiphilum]